MAEQLEWKPTKNGGFRAVAPCSDFYLNIFLDDYIVDPREEDPICSWSWSITFVWIDDQTNKPRLDVLASSIGGDPDNPTRYSDLQLAKQAAVSKFCHLQNTLSERMKGLEYWLPVYQKATKALMNLN